MIDSNLRTLRIISAAMMAAGLIYAGVVFFVVTEPVEVDMTLNLFTLVAALGSAVAILPLRRSLIGSLALMPDAGHAPAEPPSEEATRRVLARYRTGTIVSFALAESVILFGFVQAFLNQEGWRILPFLLAGELLMVMLLPRRSVVDALLADACE